MRANPAYQTLGRHADKASGDSERLDADILQTRNRADGVVGVKRRQHEVTGHCRLERNRCRLVVADFSDATHIRVLTQDRPQPAGEGESLLLVYLHLVDAAQSIFHRIFDGDDVHRFSAPGVEGGVERGGLSRARRTCDEEDSLLAHEERLESLEELRHEAQSGHRNLNGFLVEKPHYDFFADASGENRDAERHFLSRYPHFGASVLWPEPLGDVEIRHDLDA